MNTSAFNNKASRNLSGKGGNQQAQLIAKPTYHIDGVDPSMTEKFIQDHFGGELEVPQGVHFLVFRQVVLRLSNKNPKFRLGGKYDGGDKDGHTFGGGKNVMHELLATRFCCQPGVNKSGELTFVKGGEIALSQNEQIGNFRNAAIIGLFLDSYHNNSKQDIGLRVGVEFPHVKTGDGATKLDKTLDYDNRDEGYKPDGTRYARGETPEKNKHGRGVGQIDKKIHLNDTDAQRHFMYERCLRVHRFGAFNEEGTVEHYSAVLLACTTRLGVMTKLTDPVWTTTADFYRRHPYIDMSIFDTPFHTLQDGAAEGEKNVMIPAGHPVGEMVIATLLDMDKNADKGTPSALAAIQNVNVGATMWLAVPEKIVNPIRDYMKKEFREHAQSREFNNLENVCITAEALDDLSGNEDWHFTITLGILFAYMDTAGDALTSGYLPSWVVESMMAGSAARTLKEKGEKNDDVFGKDGQVRKLAENYDPREKWGEAKKEGQIARNARYASTRHEL